MGQPFHTDVAILRADRQARLVQLHEAGIIHPLRHQILGKGRTDARPRAVAFHPVLHDAKAVLPRHVGQKRRRVIPRLQRLRQTQRLDRIAPAAQPLQHKAHRHQHRMPLCRAIGPQIPVHRRLIGPFPQRLLIRPLHFARGEKQPRIIRPVSRRIRKRDRPPRIPGGRNGISLHLGIPRGSL